MRDNEIFIFSDFEGRMLIPTKLTTLKAPKEHILIPSQFCIIEVQQDSVVFPGDTIISKNDIIRTLNSHNLETDTVRCILTAYIHSNPELHKQCSLNRIGRNPFQPSKEVFPGHVRRNLREEWENFTMKVLLAKGHSRGVEILKKYGLPF